MRKQEKIAALRAVLGNESFIKNDEAVFFCPKHPHHKPKLNVNLSTDMFHCWVCDFKGKDLRRILFLKGKNDAAVKYAEELPSILAKKENEKVKYEVPVLPREFISLTDSSVKNDPYALSVMKYLFKRGLTKRDISMYKLGFCRDGKYSGMIVIPSFDSRGALNFFVGRKIYESKGEKYESGEFDKNIIFNDYMIDWDSYVTLVEGPFDAISAGIESNAIPLQGSFLSEKSLLFRKVVTSSDLVYVALDSDILKNKLARFVTSLVKHNMTVMVVPVWSSGKKDIGEMSREEFAELKKNSVPVSTTADLLRMMVQK